MALTKEQVKKLKAGIERRRKAKEPNLIKRRKLRKTTKKA